MKFTELPLIHELQDALKARKYTDATEIQQKVIPILLEGKDVIGISQTGTGKTAAFSLPILQYVAENPHDLRPGHARALILAPTRELAAQIDKAIRAYGKKLRLSYAVVYGGVGQRPQERAVAKGVDVLIATPGRLLDLCRQGVIHLNDVELFVLDEADRMLDMGFLPDIKRILQFIKEEPQTILFSATMDQEIEQLARKILRDPARIEIAPESTTVERIDQFVLYVDPDDKNQLLIELLKQDDFDHTLIFTRTKYRADRIARMLNKKRRVAEVIHGDKSQNARTRALANFRNRKANVLVATEIAARGIDVDDITHVINFDVPEDPESYVHRIGRTARAGKEGSAYLFCTGKEKSLLLNIQKKINQTIPVLNHALHSQQALESKERYKRPKRGGFRRHGNKSSRNERVKQGNRPEKKRYEKRSDNKSRDRRSEKRSNERRPRKNDSSDTNRERRSEKRSYDKRSDNKSRDRRSEKRSNERRPRKNDSSDNKRTYVKVRKDSRKRTQQPSSKATVRRRKR